MKFSTISTLGGLLSVASAGTHTEQHVCQDPYGAPSTVYQTVTVTAPGGGYPGGNNQVAQPTPYVVTGGSQVTSVVYDGSMSTVYVYPTSAPANNKDCTVAVYEKSVVINVYIVNIGITINNGVTETVTKTVTEKPTYTPTLPPTPPPTGTPPPPPTGNGTVFNVVVGADGQLKYKLDNVNAKIGDIIRFDFNSTNHTVTESTFETPCTAKAGGFKSGFQFNNQSRTGVLPPVDFKVDRTTPIWFYCGQKNPVSHCGKGMVFAVNPAGKFDEFVAKAKAQDGGVSTSISPPTGTGISTPSGTGVTTPVGTGATATLSTKLAAPTKVYYKRAALREKAFNA